MNFTPSEATLLLVLLGKSEASAIRPGTHTALQAMELEKKLRECARGG